MASYRKRAGSWLAEVRLRGVSAARSFPTKGEAQRWAEDTERQIRAGKGYSIANRTLEDALMRYSGEVSIHKPSREWETRRILWLCKQDFAKLRIDLITPQDIGRWRDARRKVVSGGTIIRDFNLLSNVFTVARREWRWITANPCSDVARPKNNQPRTRRVSPEELEKLYFVADGGVSKLVVKLFEFCIETGCRGDEAIRFTRNGESTIHIPKTKNGDARNVPLSPRAVAILDEVGRFGITMRQKDATFRKLRDKAGLRDLKFHDSRHEAITRLSKIFDVLDLARVVGHRNINELLTYYHADAETLALKLQRGATLPKS